MNKLPSAYNRGTRPSRRQAKFWGSLFPEKFVKVAVHSNSTSDLIGYLEGLDSNGPIDAIRSVITPVSSSRSGFLSPRKFFWNFENLQGIFQDCARAPP